MDLVRVEAKIRESVDQVRHHGVSIVSHRFGVRYRGHWETSDEGMERCCCPLGAVLLCSSPTVSRAHGVAAQETLGVSEDWVGGFLLAFDGATREEQGELRSDSNAGFALGAQLRQEFLGQKEKAHVE